MSLCSAATIVWTNVAGGSWNDLTNWNSGLGPVPGPSDDANVMMPGNYVITSTVDISVKSVTVGGASGTQTLLITGHTLSFTSPSTVNPNGALNLQSSALNSAAILENLGKTTLQNSSVFCPLDNFGQLFALGSSLVSNTLTTQPGSILWVRDTSDPVCTCLTVENGFTNNGTLLLKSDVITSSASLIIPNGTLTNAPGGVVDTEPGLNGPVRVTLTCEIDNQGNIYVNDPTIFNKFSAAHLNTGTINVNVNANMFVSESGASSFTNSGGGNINIISPGATFQVTGGTFNYPSGSIGGPGTFSLNNVTLNLGVPMSNANTSLILSSSTITGTVTLTDAPGKTLSPFNCTFNTPVDNFGTLTIHGPSNFINGLYTSEPGSTLRMEGDGVFGDGSLTVNQGFVSNGDILFTSNTPSSIAKLAILNGTVLNDVGHTLSVQSVGGNPYSFILNGAVDNRGNFNVNHLLTCNVASGPWSNTGTMILATSMILNQSGTSSFTNTGIGTISLNPGGGLTVVGGAFNYLSGSIFGPGPLTLSGTTVELDQPLSNATTTLTIANDIITGSATLTNATGKLLYPRGCTFNAPFDNQGTTVFNATNVFNGPLITESGSSIQVSGDPGLGSSHLTVTHDLTINTSATIVLTSTGATQGATLNVTNGTLFIAPGGFFDAISGGGPTSPRTLNAQFNSQGAIIAAQPMTITKPLATDVSSGSMFVFAPGSMTLDLGGGSLTNTGVLAEDAGDTFTISNGTFTNAPGPSDRLTGSGTLILSNVTFNDPGNVTAGLGPGPATFNIRGSLPEESTSLTTIELGGPNAGTGYDNIVVSGTATLAGSFNLIHFNGYVPTPGQVFHVLRATSLTGGYSNYSGLTYFEGVSLVPFITSTGMDLVTVGETWTRLLPTGTPPPARAGHCAVYNPTSNRMTVFGGLSASGALNDTWVFTNADGTGGNSAWIHLNPDGTPPPTRENAAAAFDPGTDRMIVFGGDDAATVPIAKSDTWMLSFADGLGGPPTWNQLAPTGTPPPARTGHASVFDPTNNTMTVFGGSSGGGCAPAFNDSWVLWNANGALTPSWTQLFPTGTPPSPREFPLAIYDAVTNRMSLIGGITPCGPSNNEVWTLSSANGIGTPAWTQLNTSGSPPSPWSMQSAVFDPTTSDITVFGGNETGGPTNQVLTLAGADAVSGTAIWFDRVASSGPPPARSQQSAVQAAQRMIVFGGLGLSGPAPTSALGNAYGVTATPTLLSDVWVLEQNTGRVVSVPPAPAPTATPRFTGFSRPPSPNPGRGATAFSVSITRRQSVDISVTDVMGRQVQTLYHGQLEPGEHTFEWQGSTDFGGRVGAGLYFVRLRAVGMTQLRKFVLIR